MENRNRTVLVNAINNEAVFAQLQIKTTGSGFDESLELFRKDARRRKRGIYTKSLSFEALMGIAHGLFEGRKALWAAEVGGEQICGELLGFDVQLIFDGGVKSHVEISKDGEVSAEFSGWEGHQKMEFIEAHATCKDCVFFRKSASVDGCSGTCIARQHEHPVGSLKLEYLGVEPGNASCDDFYEAPKPARRIPLHRPRPKALHKPVATRPVPRRPRRSKTV